MLVEASRWPSPIPIRMAERVGMDSPAYPWYQLVQGDDIEQGDLLEGCPIFLPPEDLAETSLSEAAFRWEELDVIVMSQTCDMVKGREKVTDVLLCPAWRRPELTTGLLATYVPHIRP